MKIVSLNLKMHHKQICQCVHLKILFGFLIFLGMWSHIKNILQALTWGFLKVLVGIHLFVEAFSYSRRYYSIFQDTYCQLFFGSSTFCVNILTFLIFRKKTLLFKIHLVPIYNCISCCLVDNWSVIISGYIPFHQIIVTLCILD